MDDTKPLLKHVEAPKASFRSMLALLLMTGFGPGMLSLPLNVSRAGILPSLGVSLLVGASMVWTMLLLTRCKARCEKEGIRIVTYQDFGSELLGSRRLVEVTICLYQFGVLCVYFSFMSTILDSFVSTEWIPILYVPVAVMCCLKQLRDLGYLSTVTLTIFCLSWLVTMSVCLGRLRDRTQSKGWAVVSVYAAWCYSFEGLPALVPQTVDTLEAPQRAAELMTKATLCISVVYCITEVLGSCAFTHPEDPITLSLGGFLYYVNLLLVLAVFAKYPLLFFPAISIIERNLGFGPGASLDQVVNKDTSVCISAADGGVRAICFRAFLILLTAVVAFLVADLTLLINLTGIVFAPLNAFIFPCIMDIVATRRFGPFSDDDDDKFFDGDETLTIITLIISVVAWGLGSVYTILSAIL